MAAEEQVRGPESRGDVERFRKRWIRTLRLRPSRTERSWYAKAKGSDWADFAAVRASVPHGDLVNLLLVFNI
jgi:hypothetical protein